ncbi:MAG: cytochrome c biogenesis protein CcdA [Bacteroidales bacterium]|nr:cytochrome c biogenesis protein CcdA [Bacteroidales bacterium]MDD3431986.1 cytochrome c biogenesis protein CcdA [Bacteroidales bacterium]MDD4361948.1 cytochrome c biogenesis protein CcdA [Bacteroidales bacterium]
MKINRTFYPKAISITILLQVLFLFGFGNPLQAQEKHPVQWSFELNKVEECLLDLVFTADIAGPWYLYDINLPEGGPVSTAVHYDKLEGCSLEGALRNISKAKPYYEAVFEMNLRKHEETAVFAQRIRISNPDAFLIEGYVEFMACNNENCLPPEQVEFKLVPTAAKEVASVPIGRIERSKEQENKDQAKLAVGRLLKGNTATDNSQPATGNSADKSQAAAVNSASDSQLAAVSDNPEYWSPVIDELQAFEAKGRISDSSWWRLFIFGFIGGLLALFTPCVWPIIPMTVSFFLKRSQSRKKAVSDALMYGLAIIVIYLVLGMAITLIFGASALNNMATNAVFNILFFAILVFFAVSFFGAFEIVLPSSWSTKMDAKADSTRGLLSIFFMAFTLVLVSFSCTGPIIGTLLVEAASKGSFIGPAIGMLGFALALALPFSLFAIFPNMMHSMPQSGGWLNTVKVVLAFLELALALKFLSVADLAYGWGILDREVFLVLWIVIFALLGFYLLGKIRFPHDDKLDHVSVPRLFLAIIPLAFSIYMIPGLWGAPLKAISAFAPPMSTQDFNLYDQEVHPDFMHFESGMQFARQQNKPVLLDFSGYGCVNCRKMENAVWQDARVKNLIEKEYVLITLMVDDKTTLPEIIEIEEYGRTRKLRSVGDKWSYLQRYKFGANAQPFYVLLSPEGKPLAPSYAFDENVDNFLRFLQSGLE